MYTDIDSLYWDVLDTDSIEMSTPMSKSFGNVGQLNERSELKVLARCDDLNFTLSVNSRPVCLILMKVRQKCSTQKGNFQKISLIYWHNRSFDGFVGHFFGECKIRVTPTQNQGGNCLEWYRNGVGKTLQEKIPLRLATSQ